MKSGWDIKKLGEVCELIADGDWIESKDQSTCGIRLVQTGNVGVGIFRNKEGSEHFVSSETFRRLNCTEIFGGDILISRLPDPVGRACVVPDLGQKMITAVDCSIVRLRRSVCLPTFLVYYASSAEWFNAIEAKCTGSTRKRISRKNLTDVLVPIPPLSEQKRIVAKIDAAFEKIDKLKANAEKNLANAKELFQSALDEAMRPKDGWVEKRLGEVCKTTSGGTPIKSHREYYEDGNIPWLRSGEVCCKDIIKSEMFITELGLRNSSAKIMPKNTVLIAMYGATAAQAGILRFESATNQAICGILPDKYFEPEFLYYYFRTIQRQLAARAQGGAQPNISQEKIKDTLVPILPLSEQREIVKHLDLLAEKIKILEQNYTKQIADCVEMRQAVLREAFEGRL